MKIPFEFIKNKKYYIFIGKCNDNLFLYDVYDLNRKELHYKETFQAFDLGLLKPTNVMEGIKKNPDKVVIL